MENTHAPSRSSSINMTELLSRVDNDRELLRELFAIFKEDFPGHLQALQEAVRRQDMKQVLAVSHTLKGMLLNLAVTRAAAAAGELEQLAHEGKTPSIEAALTALEREVHGLLPEMEAYTAGVQS